MLQDVAKWPVRVNLQPYLHWGDRQLYLLRLFTTVILNESITRVILTVLEPGYRNNKHCLSSWIMGVKIRQVEYGWGNWE